MAVKTFTSIVQFQAYVEEKIQKALMAAAVRITRELRNFIKSQYYNDPEFYPNIYKRTYQFLDSASYRLIGKNLAEIGIDTDLMHYFNNFDPDQVVEWAAQSMHGAPLYQTSTTDFWTAFLNWADDNVMDILKEELKNQGLNIIQK